MVCHKLGFCMQDYQIMPISEQYIESFREAVGSVARERKYFAFLDALSLEMAQVFVMENLSQKESPKLD